jgi:hypothetical protein
LFFPRFPALLLPIFFHNSFPLGRLFATRDDFELTILRDKVPASVMMEPLSPLAVDDGFVYVGDIVKHCGLKPGYVLELLL